MNQISRSRISNPVCPKDRADPIADMGTAIARDAVSTQCLLTTHPEHSHVRHQRRVATASCRSLAAAVLHWTGLAAGDGTGDEQRKRQRRYDAVERGKRRANAHQQPRATTAVALNHSPEAPIQCHPGFAYRVRYALIFTCSLARASAIWPTTRGRSTESQAFCEYR